MSLVSSRKLFKYRQLHLRFMGQEPLPVFVFGCVSCGKTVAGTEDKCPRCGASFDDVKFECPFCGELVSPRQRRCSSCGTEFGEFAEEVSETSAIDLDRESDSPPTEASQDGSVEAVTYECPQCGKPLSESDDRCPNCGARFS